jgi:hypothetical protein
MDNYVDSLWIGAGFRSGHSDMSLIHATCHHLVSSRLELNNVGLQHA